MNNDELALNILHHSENMTSQKSLADKLGYSVGKVNYVLKSLIDKGLIKIDNFTSNPNKRQYSYLLTEEGIKEKMMLTERFIERKKYEYDTLVHQLEQDKQKWGFYDD